MNPIITHLITFAIGLITGACMAVVGSLIWIAKGSPDVNGDPERDANPDLR